jgi:hypothetical protein
MIATAGNVNELAETQAPLNTAPFQVLEGLTLEGLEQLQLSDIPGRTDGPLGYIRVEQAEAGPAATIGCIDQKNQVHTTLTLA